MNKILLPAFIIACMAVIVAFVTATTYIQLGIAILLYMPLTYFAFKVFTGRAQGRGNFNNPLITIPVAAKPPEKVRGHEHEHEAEVDRRKVDVADIDKRTFLKLIGATGLSFFVFSLLGRRVDSLLFGNAPSPNAGSIGPLNKDQANQAGSFTDGYKITDIENGIISYYGFTNQEGAWFIMREDAQTSAFRYAKGDSGFSQNWTGREKLQYDYYYKLF